MKKLLFKYSINIIFWSLLAFVLFFLEPKQEKIYLKGDIEKFQNDYYWTIILIFIFLVSASITIKLFKKKEIKEFLLILINVAVFILIFSYVLQPIISAVILYGNRAINRNQKIMIYNVEYNKVHDYTEMINETKTDTINSIYEVKFIKSLNNIRTNKKLESVTESDTIHIKYKNGLFGIKYLDE